MDSKPKAPTGAERQAKLKASRKARGLVRLEMWVTPQEREKIKAALAGLRKVTPVKAGHQRLFVGDMVSSISEHTTT